VGLEYITLDPACLHPFRRRSAAHPIATSARVPPGGRSLCAGRTVHRITQPRYSQADPHPRRIARPRQYHPGGRTRSGCDSRSRLAGRSRPRRRRIGWPHSGVGQRSKRWKRNPDSLTGRYLSGQLTIPIPTRRREPMRRSWYFGAPRIQQPERLDVRFPWACWSASPVFPASGKSTWCMTCFTRPVSHALGKTEGGDPSHLYRELKGAERLNDIVLVDQAPIGRTPRSNPVTYIKASRRHSGSFSPPSPKPSAGDTRRGTSPLTCPGGRCDVVRGRRYRYCGVQFLADVELPCEGMQWNPLQSQRAGRSKYRGKEHKTRCST